MNSENNKSSKLYILIFKLTDKLDLRKGKKSIALSNLSSYHTWKSLYKNNRFKISAPTCLYKNNRFKISTPTWMMNLNCQMHHILYHILKIILSIY